MQPSNRFRKNAVENISAAERLDTAVRIVSPMSWIGLLTLSLLAAVTLVWACLGRIPHRVRGTGILINQGQVFDVTSVADGQLSRILVKVDDTVLEDQVVAHIEQPELKKQIASAQAKYDELQAKAEQLSELNQKSHDLRESYLSRRLSNLDGSIRDKEAQLQFFIKKLKSQQDLLEKGLITQTTFLETQQRVLEIQETINTRRNDERDISSDIVQTTKGLAERRFALVQQVNDTKREIEALQKRLDTQSARRFCVRCSSGGSG